jgi:hypothetical protein
MKLVHAALIECDPGTFDPEVVLLDRIGRIGGDLSSLGYLSGST